MESLSMCFYKTTIIWIIFQYWLHWYGLFSLCLCICFLRESLYKKALLHWLQLNGFSQYVSSLVLKDYYYRKSFFTVTTLVWFHSSVSLHMVYQIILIEKDLPQSLYLDVFSPVCVLMWFVKVHFLRNKCHIDYIDMVSPQCVFSYVL